MIALATASDTLPLKDQRRNCWIFLINTTLGYLVAPVFQIGVLHSAILKGLAVSDSWANLPQSAYLWVTPAPVIIAWLFPSARLLRPLLLTALTTQGLIGVAVAAAFWGELPVPGKLACLIAHAAVAGVANGVRNMCIWELLGRGVDPQLRAKTLGWTFGIGPLFAVLGSCLSQLVLAGNFLQWLRIEPIPEPTKYVLLFGCTGPVMWLSAAIVLAARTNLLADRESPRGPRGQDILRGVAEYLGNPLIRWAAVGFLLTYGGTTIMNNLSLYSQEAIGQPPEQFAGLQLALRFGFKALAGFGLGWLVARWHAKASLLATTGTCLAGIFWALVVPGPAYLFSFALLGGGELFYVYYVNYIVGSSAPHRVRENTAYTNVLSSLVGWMPFFFGLISQTYGFRASFWTAVGLLSLGILVVSTKLPRNPRPASSP